MGKSVAPNYGLWEANGLERRSLPDIRRALSFVRAELRDDAEEWELILLAKWARSIAYALEQQGSWKSLKRS